MVLFTASVNIHTLWSMEQFRHAMQTVKKLVVLWKNRGGEGVPWWGVSGDLLQFWQRREISIFRETGMYTEASRRISEQQITYRGRPSLYKHPPAKLWKWTFRIRSELFFENRGTSLSSAWVLMIHRLYIYRTI